MSEEPPATRSHEHEIEIDASVEEVWKAITDAEELTRWLCDRAKVTPGPGGTYWIAWGEGPAEQAIEKQFDVWEPGKHLRLTGGDLAAMGLAAPMVEEYTIESRQGRTVLRMVHSGIPDTPQWDGFYEGTKEGWAIFFRVLRHYLENHPGKPRSTVGVMYPLQIDRESAWATLTGPAGLGIDRLEDGEPYVATTSAGDRLEGKVSMASPLKAVALTVDNMDGAYLCAAIEEMGGMTFFWLTLSFFGLDPDRLAPVRAHWEGWLHALLPPGGAPDSPTTCGDVPTV